MKRYLCTLAICLIIIILGLYKMGIALYEYKGPQEGKWDAIIESGPVEKQYTNSYNIQISRKKFIIYIKKTEKQPEIGDRIQFNGKFQNPSKQRNEGGFDYKLYLKTKKIYGIFRAESIEKIEQAQNSISIRSKRTISKIKIYIKNIFKKMLKKENGELITALLIGDKSNVDNNIIENFRDASLSHILAISGAHFSYIILLINYINKKLKHKKIGNIMSIIIILFFMELTGNTASVVRAGTMSIIAITSELLYRKVDIWTSLSISLIIQIINNPYVIFDIGLILSYGGVIGIVLFYDIIQKKIKSKTISITLSANLVIIPIMIYNYNTVSLSFILSNICAGLLLGPIIILGFLSIIFKFKPIFILLDILLKTLQDIAQICAKIPLSKIYVRTPSIVSIILFYLLLAYLVRDKLVSESLQEKHKKSEKDEKQEKYKKTKKDGKQGKYKKTKKYEKSKKHKKLKQYKKAKIVAVFLTTIIILNLNLQVLAIQINGNLLINFVDVGQGDSTLIRIDSITLMIDSGGTTDTNSGYDLGKNTVLPYLLDKKITKLNYIMISHFDADHCQAFMYILKNIKVENAIICKQAKESNLYKEFLEICTNKKVKIIYVKNGDSIKIGRRKHTIELKILHPQKELITNNPLNNNAIVAKLIYGKFTMLFCGDIEKEAEEQIIRKNINIEAKIVKVGHHGSKTSTSQVFIEKVKPKIALIGVGEGNKFNHPNSEVLKRLKRLWE